MHARSTLTPTRMLISVLLRLGEGEDEEALDAFVEDEAKTPYLFMSNDLTIA